jgi:chromosome segregation ATPase
MTLPLIGCGPSERELALEKSSQALSQEAAQLKTELADSRQALTETRERLSQAQQRIETLQAKTAGLEQEKTDLDVAVSELQARSASLEHRTASLQSELENKAETARKAAARIASLEAEGTELQAQLADTKRTVEDTASRLATYQQELVANSAERNQAVRAKIAAQHRAEALQADNARLKGLVQPLQEGLTVARKTKAKADAQLREALAQARTLTDRGKQLEQHIIRLEKESADLKQRLQVYQTEILVAHRQATQACEQCAANIAE